MKSVFSLKDSHKKWAFSFLSQLSGIKTWPFLTVIFYVVTLIFIGVAYMASSHRMEELDFLLAKSQRLHQKFERIKEVDSMEKGFKARHAAAHESDRQGYLHTLFSRYTPLSDDIKTLHYLLGQKALMHSQDLKRQVKALEHEKRIGFERSHAKMKRKAGFIEQEFKLVEPISLQEDHFYDLLSRLESSQELQTPQLGITRLTLSVQNNNLLNIHTMKLFQREFIDHEK